MVEDPEFLDKKVWHLFYRKRFMKLLSSWRTYSEHCSKNESCNSDFYNGAAWVYIQEHEIGKPLQGLIGASESEGT